PAGWRLAARAAGISFADDDTRADGDETAQFGDLFVGESDAALGPVLQLVDLEALFRGLPDAVDADESAERRVLRGHALAGVGRRDGAEFPGVDEGVAVAVPRVHHVRVIEQHEEVEPAVRVEVGDAVDAEGRLVVAGAALGAGTAAAEGDAVAPHHVVTLHEKEALVLAVNFDVVG